MVKLFLNVLIWTHVAKHFYWSCACCHSDRRLIMDINRFSIAIEGFHHFKVATWGVIPMNWERSANEEQKKNYFIMEIASMALLMPSQTL